jgi:hypothetical protein
VDVMFFYEVVNDDDVIEKKDCIMAKRGGCGGASTESKPGRWKEK